MMKKIQKNHTNKPRIKIIKKTTRLITLTVISIILLISLIATIMAYQTPPTTLETITVAHYSHTGDYTYLVYLKNNTLYEMPFLLPNQGIYFKQIIDNINASLTYTYQSDVTGNIVGNYTMYAEINTDLWTKKYPLFEQIPFTDNNKTTTFTQEFPINYSFYDDIVNQINIETGMIASNPKLIFYTNVILQQTTTQGTIHTQYSTDLPMTLGQKTLKISENLSSRQTGILTQQTRIDHQSVVLYRNLGTASVLIVSIIFCGIFLLTKNDVEEESETEKTIKKIYKRNGEWIHKTTTPPPAVLQHLLRFSSIEDIIKISEDLNKPLFHYTTSNPSRHQFYVLDATTTYLYELSPEETKSQSVS
jgi:hypothetical protein